VDIVEGDEHGLFTAQLSKDAEETGRDRARLWVRFRLGQEERALKRTSLRTRQARQDISNARFEEVGETRMRQLRLRGYRLRRQNEVRIGSSNDRASPERRLPDPSLALQHERCREPAVCRKEPVEVRQLLLPAKDEWRAAAG
jgi:hypothetical protein